jgi:hypothetical protein
MGLDAGKYTLRIDDDLIGTFSAEELATGLNLADYPNADVSPVAARQLAGPRS